jgi:hypothetical protein
MAIAHVARVSSYVCVVLREMYKLLHSQVSRTPELVNNFYDKHRKRLPLRR